jgi:hypothetical protein
MKEEYKTKELVDRWISILRQKATYEHNARKNGEVVASPSIDDICNEMIAYFTGIIN